MHMVRKQDDVKTTVWVPLRLHRAAKIYAAAQDMSVRAVLITALAAFLAQRQEEA
jgi:hypothetical protein